MTFKTKHKPGICSVKFCTNKAKGKLCSTHRAQKCRDKDPVKYAYTTKKNNAKRKGKQFTITLEYFREFCHTVKYIGFTDSRSKEGLTVDCIINHLGYVPGNLQILNRSDNAKKYFSYDWNTKEVYEIKGVKENIAEDLPF